MVDAAKIRRGARQKRDRRSMGDIISKKMGWFVGVMMEE
jgi:hypothetical protein